PDILYSTSLRPLLCRGLPLATATTGIHTLSLHDALPISAALVDDGADRARAGGVEEPAPGGADVDLGAHVRSGPVFPGHVGPEGDRKSTRLNSSHVAISYAVFCLKKKKIHTPLPL